MRYHTTFTYPSKMGIISLIILMKYSQRWLMKIERLNENQIRCTLNKSDLASRQLKINELAYGSDLSLIHILYHLNNHSDSS